MLLDSVTALLPQPLDITDSPTFAGLILSGLDADAVVFANGSKTLSTNAGFLYDGTNVTLNGRIILQSVDDASNPTIAFGDGDTGIYSRSDDNLDFTIGGVRRFSMAGTFEGAISGSGGIRNVNSTSILPSLVPDSANDGDTGIGHAGLDQLSLIAGGVEGIRITEDTTITINLNGVVNIPLDNTALSIGLTQTALIDYDSVGNYLEIDLKTSAVDTGLNVMTDGNDNTLFIDGSASNGGRIGILTNAPDAPFHIIKNSKPGYISRTNDIMVVEQQTASPDTATNLRAGLFISEQLLTSGGASSRPIFGINSIVYTDSLDTQGNTNQMVGGRYAARILGTGDVTNARGLAAEIQHIGNSTVTNAVSIYAEDVLSDGVESGANTIVTNAYNIYCVAHQVANSAIIENAYGVYLEEQTDGSTINNELFIAEAGGIWFRDQTLAIFSQANSFLDIVADGAVRIGDANPSTEVAPTNYSRFSSTGDLYFVGTAGLPLAEIYNKEESGNTIELDADLADVKIPFANNGQSNNCTADSANDKITITVLGKYFVTASIVCSIDVGGSTEVEINGYLNGVVQASLHAHRAVASAAGAGAIPISGFIDVTSVPWDLDLRANVTDSNPRDVTFSDTNLLCVQFAGT